MNEGTGTIVTDITGTHNLTKPADVTWFGTAAGVESVSGAALNIESKIYGHTLEVSNKTNGKLQLSIYSVTGQKVMEDILIVDTKFQKQLAHLKGAYILKCVAKDGSTYTKRFIVM